MVSTLDVIFPILLVFGHEGTCVYGGHGRRKGSNGVKVTGGGFKPNKVGRVRVDRVSAFMRGQEKARERSSPHDIDDWR